MDRFQINEIVTYCHDSSAPAMEIIPGVFKRHDGHECTIVSGTFPSPLTGAPSRKVIFSDGWRAGVAEIYLRKRKPPASPFTFEEIISMCNDRSITEQVGA